MRSTGNTRYVEAVARNLATRLHTSKRGFRCRCGQCRHVIMQSALRSGIAPQRLVKALPPEPKPDRQERRRRPMTAQVASSMKVIRDGHMHEGPTALLVLLGAK